MDKDREIKDIKIEPSKLRPCCACPETRKLRDNCIMNNGEENCLKFIEDHKNCLKELGFHV
jgi:cytochrome c oxidase assembly protein subunit 17